MCDREDDADEEPPLRSLDLDLCFFDFFFLDFLLSDDDKVVPSPDKISSIKEVVPVVIGLFLPPTNDGAPPSERLLEELLVVESSS